MNNEDEEEEHEEEEHEEEDEEEQWIQGKARNRESQPQDRLVWPAPPYAGSDP